MSSILTNTSAMVALQTLKGINSALAKTQAEISTGKSVASAKDNAAVWAISKVMESDVKGFSGISDSLALGESTVAVARKASERITDLLTDMKGKIVAAQESNVDRAKLQTDIDALVDQIESVVGAAQFNGLNLVDGSSTADVQILSSLDRDSSGGVSAAQIDVARQDLGTGGYTSKGVLAGSVGVSTDADAASFFLDKDDTTGKALVINSGTDAFAAGDSISVRVGNREVSYTVTAQDVASTTPDDMVAVGLKNAIDALGITDLQVDYDSDSPGTLTFLVADGDDAGTDDEMDQDLTITAQFKNANSGGLGELATINVTTSANAAVALGNIETLIQTAVDAASAFGSAESRITTQANFISDLTDAMKTGIGSLVDADMEEASARLQALQTQQQLGIQALSIANQQPQNILALFR
ncbi:flagellin [Frigidibacter albus]|uniref:Flagellin n=1 Tax=Frigidibacter albus TaxID=1465486 RepID=A0A6L8VKR0_9RHOB|nr:flagellin [Frigidibacter albus]MZQ90296.1 flagellin [Frigidibacter albus]NBE32206.1 flagellin [Frigidibacter albus]GGH58616.1 flagellin [Frigidibacter albus]